MGYRGPGVGKSISSHIRLTPPRVILYRYLYRYSLTAPWILHRVPLSLLGTSLWVSIAALLGVGVGVVSLGHSMEY